MKHEMKLNLLLGALALMLSSTLILQISCKKEEICQSDQCPGMLICKNNECGCAEDNIVVAGSLCVYPEIHTYLALSNAGGNLPENFFFYFVGNNDTIQGPVGQYKIHDLSYNASSYNRKGGIFTTYTKASFPPEGVTGDGFRLNMPYPVYPAGPNNGYCDVYINGTFVHPDTISAIVSLVRCKPDSIPEANNQYRVTFARIKRP
jgi:hypothetical protein